MKKGYSVFIGRKDKKELTRQDDKTIEWIFDKLDKKLVIANKGDYSENFAFGLENYFDQLYETLQKSGKYFTNFDELPNGIYYNKVVGFFYKVIDGVASSIKGNLPQDFYEIENELEDICMQLNILKVDLEI